MLRSCGNMIEYFALRNAPSSVVDYVKQRSALRPADFMSMIIPSDDTSLSAEHMSWIRNEQQQLRKFERSETLLMTRILPPKYMALLINRQVLLSESLRFDLIVAAHRDVCTFFGRDVDPSNIVVDILSEPGTLKAWISLAPDTNEATRNRILVRATSAGNSLPCPSLEAILDRHSSLDGKIPTENSAGKRIVRPPPPTARPSMTRSEDDHSKASSSGTASSSEMPQPVSVPLLRPLPVLPNASSSSTPKSLALTNAFVSSGMGSTTAAPDNRTRSQSNLASPHGLGQMLRDLSRGRSETLVESPRGLLKPLPPPPPPPPQSTPGMVYPGRSRGDTFLLRPTIVSPHPPTPITSTPVYPALQLERSLLSDYVIERLVPTPVVARADGSTQTIDEARAMPARRSIAVGTTTVRGPLPLDKSTQVDPNENTASPPTKRMNSAEPLALVCEVSGNIVDFLELDDIKPVAAETTHHQEIKDESPRLLTTTVLSAHHDAPPKSQRRPVHFDGSATPVLVEVFITSPDRRTVHMTMNKSTHNFA